jgi:hypothetical protein
MKASSASIDFGNAAKPFVFVQVDATQSKIIKMIL